MSSRNNDTSSSKPSIIEIPVQHFNSQLNENTHSSRSRPTSSSNDQKYGKKGDRAEPNYEQNRNLNHPSVSVINNLINSNPHDYKNSRSSSGSGGGFSSSQPFVSAFGGNQPAVGSVIERPNFESTFEDQGSRPGNRPNRREFSIPIVHENLPPQPQPSRPDYSRYTTQQEYPSHEYKDNAYNLDNNNNTRPNYTQNTTPNTVNYDTPNDSSAARMGNTSGNENKKAKTTATTHSQANSASQSQSQPAAQEQQQPAPLPPPSQSQRLTPEDKCNEIYEELKRLEADAEAFAGQKDDKTFRKIEEFLTLCCIKLDEVDRTDDNVRQQCRKLIKFSDEISAKLEQKAVANGHQLVLASQLNQP